MSLLLVGAACSPAGANDMPENSVLRLELAQCHNGNEHRATAFAVDDGYALSVAHAFDNVDGFRVLTADQRELQAEVVFLDAERDISVLRISGDDTPEGLSLRSAADDDNDARFATFAEEDGPDTKDATILRFVRLTLDGVGDRAGIELAADIVSGDSGGPLLDDDGRVIGMVFATSRRGERGWAIATAELESALEARQDEAIERPCAPR